MGYCGESNAQAGKLQNTANDAERHVNVYSGYQKIEENFINIFNKELNKDAKNLTYKFNPIIDTISGEDGMVLCNINHVKC